MEEKPAELPASPASPRGEPSQGGPVSPQVRQPADQIQAPSLLDKIKIHKFKILGGILGVLVFLGAVFGAYKFGQRQVQFAPQPTLIPISTPTIIVTPTPSPKIPPAVTTPKPTPALEIYQNDLYDYSLQYPEGWHVRQEGSHWVYIDNDLGGAFSIFTKRQDEPGEVTRLLGPGEVKPGSLVKVGDYSLTKQELWYQGEIYTVLYGALSPFQPSFTHNGVQFHLFYDSAGAKAGGKLRSATKDELKQADMVASSIQFLD